MNFLKLTHDKLSVENISDLVYSENCGAVSIFVGTTRDKFEEKKVLSLEYEVYESMALKEMEKICENIRDQWNVVENIAIYHRLGLVPVKEASVVIAISSPHRTDAIKATDWCINKLKESVPIWKKEIYEKHQSEWKENKESCEAPKMKKIKLEIKQEIELPYIPPHLIQIKASNEELDKRIESFILRKRSEIDVSNIAEFCGYDRGSEFICARVDATLKKRKDSKGHLQVNRVLNTYQRDQSSSEYLTKYIPPNGVEERLQNLETQLSLITSTPKNIYKRLKILEDRLLLLESISPEYLQFWDKTAAKSKPIKKKIFSIEEIDCFIKDLEDNVK